MTTAVTTTPLPTGTWTIDTVHSNIGFSVRHLMVSKVKGTFDTFTGSITVTEDGTPSVSADIDVRSINTRNEQRDNHVRSADFFDAENFPTATFRSTGVSAKGDDWVLEGDFTLKGVCRPVWFDLEFNGVNAGMGAGQVAGFEARTVLNRKDFGIDLELPLETGGTVVGDKVTITLEIEAVQQG